MRTQATAPGDGPQRSNRGGGPEEHPPAPPQSAEAHPPRPAWKRWLWMSAGAALMALAVWMALRSGGMAHALNALSEASAPVVAALVILPLASWLLTSTLFWVLTRRFGRVAWTEMSALIAASWLLNNLPMRPGMIGRVAYHRTVNRIPVRASVRVMVEALLCSALAGAFAVAALAVAAGEIIIGAGLAAGASIAAAGALLALSRRGRPLPLWLLFAGTAIRLADIASWVVRYWLLLGLAGLPVSPLEAMAVTIASMLASLTPVQFGLREWAVGAAASVVGAAASGGTMLAMGLAADVINRGIELLLAVPIGLVAAWAISRRLGPARERLLADQRAREANRNTRFRV